MPESGQRPWQSVPDHHPAAPPPEPVLRRLLPPLLIVLVFLVFLVFLGRRRGGAKHIPWYDYLAAASAGAGVLYLVVDYLGIQNRFGIPIQREVVLGWVTIGLLLEATRRSLGPSLVITGGLFLRYAMMGPRGAIPITLPDLIAHRGYPLARPTLGGTAEKVSRHVEVPVLLVR